MSPSNHEPKPLCSLVNLIDPSVNLFFDLTANQAALAVGSGEVDQIRQIDGQYAVVHQTGPLVRMARTIARPMRYYFAKIGDDPNQVTQLVVAERIDEIRDYLTQHDAAGSFDPVDTRMVPAHYLLEVNLNDPTETSIRYERFLTPKRHCLPADLDTIGETYIRQLTSELDRWLDIVEPKEPIGVMFSGGIDSGSVFLLLNHLLHKRGDSLERLHAFTLSIDGEGSDAAQSKDFLEQLNLDSVLEIVSVPLDAIDYRKAIAAVEDYKPLDIQSATVGYAVCEAIRNRYPDWRWLIDGDGGDENLKDYPIEDNRGLTIQDVLENRMLYQEGWGIDALKHSKTYSGGQSRGHARTWAPGRLFGFSGLSPYALPNVIEIAEGIPFIELTQWDHRKLYALKGEVVRRGVKAVTGFDMPVYPKRRFQHGAASTASFSKIFPALDSDYRRAFTELHA
ncbi:asparagine synthase-related protein [Planctomycetes bacterium CA13]